MTKLLWQPKPEQIEKSAMRKFQRFAEQKTSRVFSDYGQFHEWSCTEFGLFWQTAVEFLQIKWRTPPSKPYEAGKSMRSGKWFPGGTLNYAENLLANLCAEPVIACKDTGERCAYSREQLLRDVAGIQAWLKRQGVVKGDRVAAVVTNSYEAVSCMLATAALGATWSSCSPDFGLIGIRDRFVQIAPKVVFFSEEYDYGGKKFKISETISALKKLLPEAVWARVDNKELFNSIKTTESTAPTFEPVAFDHPLYILFSSGTTGVPKCIVHGHGGTLLQLRKELTLHSNVGTGDTLLFYTTCGWMMWNWMTSALAAGAKIVLFDGSPAFPHSEKLWELADQENVTHLGTSPKYIGSCLTTKPKYKYAFKNLRCILTTGSPLLDPHFQWIYECVKADIHLASISGGTDIVSCFMLGNPNLPVYSGEIQCLGLGMDVEVWSEEQEPVIGKKGELVCKSPFVSMPVGFWNDPDGKKYRKAYFDFYSGHDVWRHGDFIEKTEHGGIIVYGRSDATLNPGGVRIGTAELYRAVEEIEGVVDSIAVARKTDDDVEIVLFLKLKTGKLDAEKQDAIKKHIRKQLSPRHIPAKIFQVSDIPFTRSGKKMELLVSQLVNGEPPGNLDSVANPECLEQFKL